MSSSSNGGAINDESTNNLLIEGCTFEQCTSGYVGAIRVVSGNAVFNRICGYKCESTSTVCFSTIESDSSRTINTVHDSSVAYCVASNDYTMYHLYGYIDIK